MSNDLREIDNAYLQTQPTGFAQDWQMQASQPRRLVDYRLRNALAYMRNNLCNPCISEDVAKKVGLSRSRFFELFQSQLGVSPLAHWNAIRLEEAIKRLNSGEENITYIALDLGFSNSGNFSRFFRVHTGVTPSSYRRTHHAH